AAAMSQLSKQQRDALLVQNVVANARVTGRASVIAGRIGANATVMATAVSAVAGSISLATPARTQVANILVGVEGLGSYQTPVVAGGAEQEVTELVPVTSFTFQLESVRDLAGKIRLLGQSVSESVRESINRELAHEAGLPEIKPEIQH